MSPAISQWAWRTLILCGTMIIAACSPSVPEERFVAAKVSFSDLAGWPKDNHLQALEVFLTSCETLAKNPRPITEKSEIVIDNAAWGALCEGGKKAGGDAKNAKAFFETHFIPYRIGNNQNAEGLFTGYYEPLLYGALQEKGDFRYPIYGVPDDLKKDAPYLTREEIDTAGLKGRAPVLVWVNDPVMLFFMHVQGSGRIRLADGKEMRLGFAARNNQPYGSLGKVLREEKLLDDEDLNFFTIRNWLYKNPDKTQAMLWRNPSYIFFKKLEGAAPVGAIGVELTPGRSLAVDKRYIPYGLPIFLQTQLPALEKQEPAGFNRLMIAQDTGSAIKGPVRGDIFFGSGKEAEYYAGMMKSAGGYSLLVPKSIAAQLP